MATVSVDEWADAQTVAYVNDLHDTAGRARKAWAAGDTDEAERLQHALAVVGVTLVLP